MTHVDLGMVASAQAKASGNQLTFTNDSGSTIPAGALLICAIVCDNPASVTAPGMSTPTNNTGTTWNFFATTNSSGVTTTAGSGIWCYSFYLYTVNSLAAGATITVTQFSTNVVARAGVMRAFTGLVGAPYGVATATSIIGGPGTTTSANVENGDVCIGIGFAESDTATGDSDTSNGTWSAFTSSATSGSTAVTNVIVGTQAKDVTAAATQTYNLSSSNDSAVHVGAFRVLTNISGSDTGAVTVTESSSILAMDAISTTATSAITIAEISSVNIMGSVRTALANRATTPVNIGMIGASVTEGFPATREKSIEWLLAERLRSIYPTAGGPKGIGAWGNPSTPVYSNGTSDVVYTGSGSVYNETGGWGPKHATWYEPPGSSTGVVYFYTGTTGPWTSFDINIVAGPGGHAQGGAYIIDGGSVQYVSNYAATLSLKKIHVAQAVTNNVVLGSTVNGTDNFIVNSISGYQGNETKGITVHNFGHSGYTIDQWMRNDLGRPNWLDDIVAEDLDLLVLGELGVNDANAAGSAHLTSSQFRTKYSDFIDYIRSLGYLGPILCTAAFDVQSAITFVEPWSNYVTVIKEVAASKGCQFLDYSKAVPASPNSIYHTDSVHSNTNGDLHSLVADAILAEIIGNSVDSSRITIGETSEIFVPIAASDTSSIAVAESKTLGVNGTDTSSISIAESKSTFVTINVGDGAAISVAETAPVSTFSGYSALVVQKSPLIFLRLGESSGTTAVDSSGNGHHATYNNTPTLGVEGAISGSSDTAVTFAAASLEDARIAYFPALILNTLTMECWVKTTATGQAFMGRQGTTQCPYSMTTDATGRLLFVVKTTGSTTYNYASTGAVINDGNWHHLVIVRDGTIGAATDTWFYVDGVLDASFDTITPNQTATFGFAVSGRGGTPYLDGSIDEVALYNTALSPAQVAENYAAGAPTQVVGSDTSSVTISESSTVAGSSVSTETSAITISSSSSLSVIQVGSESPAIAISETATVVASFSTTDTSAIAITDASTSNISLGASETESIATTETRQVSAATSTNDFVAISVNESWTNSIASVRVDTVILTISETTNISISRVLSASESNSLSISDSSGVTDTSASIVKVWSNGVWNVGTFKVFVGGSWQQFPIYVYRGGIWT